MDEIEVVGGVTEQDFLDELIAESGHVAPPPNSITVDQYLARVIEKGGQISRNTALLRLMAKVESGELNGDKMSVDGRSRWVFWPANHKDKSGG